LIIKSTNQEEPERGATAFFYSSTKCTTTTGKSREKKGRQVGLFAYLSQHSTLQSLMASGPKPKPKPIKKGVCNVLSM
jgi:hypothetical protein